MFDNKQKDSKKSKKKNNVITSTKDTNNLEIIKEKRSLKLPITFKLELNEEQKLAKTKVYDKDVSIILGKAASGKTQWSVLVALDYLFNRRVSQIIISRPIVKNNIGFLPGDITEKMAPHISPIQQCMYACYDKAKIDKLFLEKTIQILPIDFMKGTTFRDSFVIIDEFQDLDYEDFKLCLTRLGKDSKLVFVGSKEQIDRHTGMKNSCIEIVQKLKDSNLVNYHVFEKNHRNEAIYSILEYLDKK